MTTNEDEPTPEQQAETEERVTPETDPPVRPGELGEAEAEGWRRLADLFGNVEEPTGDEKEQKP